MALSTIAAGVPVAVLLAALAFFHMQAHLAAGSRWSSASWSLRGVRHAGAMAGKAAGLGGVSGLLPIGWIVLNIIFLHRLTDQNGSFKVLQDSISGITEDRRLQLLLIAFSFGAFFEGGRLRHAGGGDGAILIGLGFSPLAASGLSLIANTAPVAFGALGTPIITLAKVTATT
jgi:lactate permease